MLAVLLMPCALYSRTFTIHNYGGDSSSLTVAFSPNATDASNGSNPTLVVKDGQTVTVPIPNGVRIWWWTSGTGWQFGTPDYNGTTTGNAVYNAQLYRVEGGSLQYWETPPETTGTTESVTPAQSWAMFTAGLLIAFMPATILIPVYALRAGIKNSNYTP